MAQITLTIPDEIHDRVIDALCGRGGYREIVIDEKYNEMPNPVTKAQFAKQELYAFMQRSTVAFEASRASDTARENAMEAARKDTGKLLENIRGE